MVRRFWGQRLVWNIRSLGLVRELRPEWLERHLFVVRIERVLSRSRWTGFERMVRG